jgi:sulfur-oxidizing protein SoxY
MGIASHRAARCLQAVIPVAALATLQPARAEDTEAARQARWHDVARAVFNNRPVTDGLGLISIEAPPRALDAALVPIGITVAPQLKPVALTLIIDDNPAPVAGIVHFGKLADPHALKLRVRVDQYTLIHAVAELPDGRLLAVSAFVKAAGGCSAPGTTNQAEAMARIGRMKLFATASQTPGTTTAELLVSHPNYNGMQMDPVTRFYTPARYIRTITVSQGGERVFSMDGDISLSQDPAITFRFHPNGAAKLDVEVDDSAKAVFRQSFEVGQHAS